MGEEEEKERVNNKTKMLMNLKTEVNEIKQMMEEEKGKMDKLQKRLGQVGPALDDILTFFFFFILVLSYVLSYSCVIPFYFKFNFNFNLKFNLILN